jgi:hypothetical protein
MGRKSVKQTAYRMVNYVVDIKTGRWDGLYRVLSIRPRKRCYGQRFSLVQVRNETVKIGVVLYQFREL